MARHLCRRHAKATLACPILRSDVLCHETSFGIYPPTLSRAQAWTMANIALYGEATPGAWMPEIARFGSFKP